MQRNSLIIAARVIVSLVCAVLFTFAMEPGIAWADEPEPVYQTLDELAGKRFAYLNGSVYHQNIEAKLEGTQAQFYASLADCVAAVETGKADAAVQLSFGCQLVVNRKGGSVAMLPESVDNVEEGFFFKHGDPIVEDFNKVIKKFEEDGTIDELTKKWVNNDDSVKTLPEQEWDAPNGTLSFATPGVLEPFSYVGAGGAVLGYDVDLALLIAKELGYHLEISAIGADAIIASVETGKVDFGGTLTRTDERAEAVEFSEPVMPCTIAVIVQAKNAPDATSTLEIGSFDELDGKKIGVVNNTVNAQITQENLGGKYKFSYFNSVADMVAALQAGKIDAFVGNEPVCKLSVERNSGIAMMPDPIVESDYGYIFHKGNPLVDQFNKVLETMESDGTLASLKEKWTGADDSVKVLPEQNWEMPNGTLKMGTGAQAEPLTYIRDGRPTGYDIEVAMLVCKELGYGVEVEAQEFASTLIAVQTGKTDFAGSCISITAERAEKMDFSIPNYHGATVVVVRTHEPTTATTASGIINDFKDSFRKTFREENRWQLIISGLGVTVVIAVSAGVLGTLLGFVTVLARRGEAKWPKRIVDVYQALMGGVPIVVVLMVLYYVVFGSIDISGVIVAILAFTLSFGSTAGTTMWTAVHGMDVIQEETGLALGYTRQQVFRKIIFPQARTLFLPQLAAQFVSLLKETSVVGYIAVQDLTRASDLIRARTMDAFFPLISTAIIYFITCRLLSRVLGRLAAKLDATKSARKIEGVEL